MSGLQRGRLGDRGSCPYERAPSRRRHDPADVHEAPTRFECFACGLVLSTEAQLHAAELGDLYSVEIGEDPASFYGIDTDPYLSDYEPDYGND